MGEKVPGFFKYGAVWPLFHSFFTAFFCVFDLCAFKMADPAVGTFADPASVSGRHRGYFITHYDLTWVPEQTNGVKFCAYQHEICPRTNREHIQAVLWFSNAIGRRALMRRIGACYAAPVFSLDAAERYCTKEETRKPGTVATVWGEKPSQGKRSDLDACKSLLDATGSMAALYEEHFATAVRYHHGFRDYLLTQRNRQREESSPTKVLAIWGPPGSGKSSLARFLGHSGNSYWLPHPNCGTVWWDGYDGQPVVVIDDFNGFVPRQFMLTLIDRYPLSVRVHGGRVEFNSLLVILTSNKPPAEWWPNIGLGPMERRLREYGCIVHLWDAAHPWTRPEGDRDDALRRVLAALPCGEEELLEAVQPGAGARAPSPSPLPHFVRPLRERMVHAAGAGVGGLDSGELQSDRVRDGFTPPTVPDVEDSDPAVAGTIFRRRRGVDIAPIIVPGAVYREDAGVFDHELLSMAQLADDCDSLVCSETELL